MKKWVWVRPPPTVWEFFPHNPVFFSDIDPNRAFDISWVIFDIHLSRQVDYQKSVVSLHKDPVGRLLREGWIWLPATRPSS